MLRQLGLLPAGCQRWLPNMLAGTKTSFAYCSTLAVYIYEMTSPFQEYKLTSINAEHRKPITSISWNTKSPNLIATSGADNKIVIWDIAKQKVLVQLPDLEVIPSCIDWVTGQPNLLSFIGEKGVMQSWDINSGKITPLKNIKYGGSSRVLIFRWHHTKQNTIAFGHEDGTISLCIQNKGRIEKRTLSFSDGEDVDDDKVVLLSWDPLSDDYLLVANKLSGVRLIDSNNGGVITAFVFPSNAVSAYTFSWVPSAPGMFLTGDKANGVLRLWTVGQEQPLENIKIKPTGFSSIHVLDKPQNRIFDNASINKFIQRKASQSQVSAYSIPPADVVCTFLDGGVGLYDILNKKWHFLREHGHIETIFDCKFKPDDPKKLATASFDGTLKIWSVNNLTAVKTSAGNEGVIYSLSWAPDNINCIVAGTRDSGVFVWDFEKGKVIKRFREHGESTVYCVAWNKRDSHCIASGSADGRCIVRRLDGKKVREFHHPAPVFGCEWNIFDKKLLATGCDDGVARIWDVCNTSECLHQLEGHADKVFHVRWHPLIKNILCTGSDDFTVRVWDIDQEPSHYCIAVLTGHEGKVRGLMWNYEIPYMLVSGSWDSTIRVWDVRESNQKCLEIIKDHGADVYGLTSHPSTPFLLASSSRDSTVRIWTLAPLLTSLFTKIIAGHPFDDIISTPMDCMKSESDLKLAGTLSKKIVGVLKQNPKSAVVKYRWFSELFCANPALENLWDVTCHVAGMKESSLSSDYKLGILHASHLTKYRTAEAQELELSVINNSQSGSKQQEAVLDKALQVHLKLGNLQKHCEMLKRLGRWETALSLAPGVSMEYWRLLANEYVKLLHECNDPQSLSYQIALGDDTTCVKDLMDSGEYEDALVVAQSALESKLPTVINKPSNNVHEKVTVNAELESLKSDCILKLSQMKYLDGDPCRAATYLVSNNDVSGAIKSLIPANELLLAFCIGRVLKNHVGPNDLEQVAVLLSRKLEGEKYYFFAIEILKLVADENYVDGWSIIHASCARYNGEESHRENLYTYAGLPSPDQFKEQGEKHSTKNDMISAMNCLLLSSNQEKGLKIGLSLLCQVLMEKKWTVKSHKLKECDAVFNVSSAILTRPKMLSRKNRLLAISAYLGALKAMNKGYFSVVAPLLEHSIAMCERFELMSKEFKGPKDIFPLQSSEIRTDLKSWRDYESNKPNTADSNFEDILLKAGVKTIERDENYETMVAGSSLPSHSDSHISSITNKKIKGPVFRLEDDTTFISLNEAIMWARVNQFSPTGSGQRIFPF